MSAMSRITAQAKAEQAKRTDKENKPAGGKNPPAPK